MIYIDTSVLVAYYIPDPLSNAAQRFLQRQSERAISDLVEVELISVIARKVRRQEMLRRDARRVQTLFLSHLDAGIFLRWPVSRPHYVTARDWLSLTTLPLLTLDAVHLAVAASQQATVATCDVALARAARALGVPAQLIRR